MKVLPSMSFLRALLWGCLFAVASPVQAALIASSAVTYDEGNSAGTFQINGTTQINGGTSVIGYNSTIVPGLATSASATSLYGALHASAFSGAANANLGQSTTQVRAQGDAFSSDFVTFTSSTLTGSAFAHAIFSLSGILNSLSDPGTTANSTIAARITAHGNTVFSTSGQLLSQSGQITINDMTRAQSVNGVANSEPVSGLTGSFAFDIPFVFNVGFVMTADLVAATQALSGIPGKVSGAHSDFGSTGLWGGISDVHLANGTILSGYGLTSASGFDWLNAFPTAPGPIDPGTTVPLPATLWLLVASLPAVIATRRGRKTIQSS
jgi:hypothetical protein